MAQTEERCMICHQNTLNYIRILDHYICKECEKEIINLDREGIKYQKYMMMFSNLWREYFISIGANNPQT